MPSPIEHVSTAVVQSTTAVASLAKSVPVTLSTIAALPPVNVSSTDETLEPLSPVPSEMLTPESAQAAFSHLLRFAATDPETLIAAVKTMTFPATSTPDFIEGGRDVDPHVTLFRAIGIVMAENVSCSVGHKVSVHVDVDARLKVSDTAEDSNERVLLKSCDSCVAVGKNLASPYGADSVTLRWAEDSDGLADFLKD